MKMLNYRLVNNVHVSQGLYYPLPYGKPGPRPYGVRRARGVRVIAEVTTTHRAALT